MNRLLLALLTCLAVGASVFLLAGGLFSDSPVEGIGPGPEFKGVEDDGDKLPTAKEMEALAEADPIAFLRWCHRRHEREVEGYSLTMQKTERIGGEEKEREVIEVHFKEEPHSVFFRWREGKRLASTALYVEGQNDGKLLAKPTGLGGFLPVVSRDPEGADARESGRYTLKEFGLKKGLERILASWEAAREEGALHVEYLGKKPVEQTSDRECFVFKRSGYKRPEADGVMGTVLYVDAETWLMVGTLLTDERGGLIGEYFFRDIRLNPQFDEGQFTRAALSN